MTSKVFNVGGYLTQGDYALQTDADFQAVVEHRLVLARVRNEALGCGALVAGLCGLQLVRRLVMLGHAGVGVASLWGAPLSLPTRATSAFAALFAQRRDVRCHLPIAYGRVVHLVVVCGCQGVLLIL